MILRGKNLSEQGSWDLNSKDKWRGGPLQWLGIGLPLCLEGDKGSTVDAYVLINLVLKNLGYSDLITSIS